jgi:hypothetical protein
VQSAALDPVDKRAALVGTPAVDDVLERLADERGSLPVGLADLVQPLQYLRVDHQQPAATKPNITNSL